MRIIHTADWHLCDRLGRLDRTNDLKRRVERVAELCDERAADLLLIAGDLFSEQASIEQMTDALLHVRGAFAAFLARGGTILAITGNHDRDRRIDLARAGMSLAAPPTPMGGRFHAGRLYLLNRCFHGTLAAPSGEVVQFVLVPYPILSRFDLSATTYRTKEEENRLLHGQVASWVQGVAARPQFDLTLPTVLVAHLHIRGVDLGGHSKYVLTDRDDVLFEFADLNPMWAYGALGHIHKPQTVSGQTNVRYPGSLDRLDFGETHEDHGVLLLEIGPTGLLGEPERLPLPATPFHTIELNDPAADLPTLAERYPDRDAAIVRVAATGSPSALSRDEVQRQLHDIFPRLHELTWPSATSDESVPGGFTPRSDFGATIRDYLAPKLAEDPDREAVLALAETFLPEGGEA